jgi:hypothetical protein
LDTVGRRHHARCEKPDRRTPHRASASLIALIAMANGKARK